MNRLDNATSPYLQQHAANPVDWWEWGEQAFTAAREGDVPVLLSVGARLPDTRLPTGWLTPWPGRTINQYQRVRPSSPGGAVGPRRSVR